MSGSLWGPRRRWETPNPNFPTPQRTKNIITDGYAIKLSKVDVISYEYCETYHKLLVQIL